jgi:hypothetical protein
VYRDPGASKVHWAGRGGAGQVAGSSSRVTLHAAVPSMRQFASDPRSKSAQRLLDLTLLLQRLESRAATARRPVDLISES